MRRCARLVSSLERVDEHQQRESALLVDRRSQELPDFSERGAAALAAHRSNDGHLDTDEPIALAVLTGPGLEEALEYGNAGRVRARTQLAADGCSSERHRAAPSYRSYDSRLEDGDCRIKYVSGFAQNIDRSSARLEAPP